MVFQPADHYCIRFYFYLNAATPTGQISLYLQVKCAHTVEIGSVNYTHIGKVNGLTLNMDFLLPVKRDFSLYLHENEARVKVSNKRPTGPNGHLGIRDSTMTFGQKGSHLHINSLIIE